MTTSFSLSYDDAIKDVRQCVKDSGTSFASGMAILGTEARDAMHALYAFCRVVDDIADDSETPEQRASELQVWRERIHTLFRKHETSESITTALFPAIERFNLKEKDFLDIIRGMEMDGPDPVRAPSMDALDLYCDLVASAVGRVSVRIFGDPGENALRTAHHLGRAFQLTNILRDLGEDAARGRLYLPAELLAKHDLETQEDPEDVLNHPNLRAVCRDLAAIAIQHFEQADLWMKKSNPRAMRPAKIMRHYYGLLLHKLLKTDWVAPRKRISLSRLDKILLALRSVVA